MRLKFFIPLLYAYQTRMGNSMVGLIKWICEYVIPTLFCFLLSTPSLNSGSEFYVLILLLIYTLYEIGYIQNDTETIKKELKPTLRLSLLDISYYEKHKYSVYGVRIFISVILSLLILLLSDFTIGGIVAVLVSWCILLVFLLYNAIRGTFSFLLHSILLILRYSAFLFIFTPNLSYSILFLSFAIYPIPNIMEIMGSGKFGKKFNFSKIYLKSYDKRYFFRIKYYFILLMVTIFFTLIGSCNPYFVALPLFLMCYKILFLFVIKTR